MTCRQLAIGVIIVAVTACAPSPSPDDVQISSEPAVSTTPTATTPASTVTTEPEPTADEREEAEAAVDLSCEGWELVFSDGFSGDAVDEDDWNIYDSPGHDGNGKRRPRAITVADGILTITARSEDGVIVSGGMATWHTQSYGRFEAMVRTDPDPNAVVSGVILTWPADNDWPNGGENDFYETGSRPEREPFHSYIHYPDGTEKGAHREITHYADGSDWHHMTMIWSPLGIDIWRDGEWIGTIDDPDVIPHVEHRMTIQLDAKRTAEFVGEVAMEVDWVRIYQAADSEADAPAAESTDLDCRQNS